MTPEQLANIARRNDHANASYGDDWLISAKHAFDDRDALLAEVKRLREELRSLRGTAKTHHESPSCSSVIDELRTEVERLTGRLKAAEDVATAFGWTAVGDGDREKAASTLYNRWVATVGLDFAGPKAHHDLSIRDLAREYDEHRARLRAELSRPLTDNERAFLNGGEGE